MNSRRPHRRVGAVGPFLGREGTRWAWGVIALAACSSEMAPPSELELLASGDLVTVDLTHPLSADNAYWPGPAGNPFRHDTLRAHPSGSPSMAAYSTPEHHGTHLDAPIHGRDGLASVDELTSSDLFGPAVLVDVRTQVGADPDYRVTRQDLELWEESHGPLPDGAIVLTRTGWADRWKTPERYSNLAEDGTLHFPGFSEEAARFLIEERSIRGIGIDTPSVDAGSAEGFPVHGIVNGAGKYHLENLADLSRVPESGSLLIVAPIKISGGSGGQVRVWAVLPPEA